MFNEEILRLEIVLKYRRIVSTNNFFSFFFTVPWYRDINPERFYHF